MPHDHEGIDDLALLHAELRSVYAQLEHVSAIATALQAALHGLLDALDTPARPGLATQIRRAHFRLSLREARDAMRKTECCFNPPPP